jgi:hypothetical protein
MSSTAERILDAVCLVSSLVFEVKMMLRFLSSLDVEDEINKFHLFMSSVILRVFPDCAGR